MLRLVPQGLHSATLTRFLSSICFLSSSWSSEACCCLAAISSGCILALSLLKYTYTSLTACYLTSGCSQTNMCAWVHSYLSYILGWLCKQALLSAQNCPVLVFGEVRQQRGAVCRTDPGLVGSHSHVSPRSLLGVMTVAESIKIQDADCSMRGAPVGINTMNAGTI